MKNGLYEIYRVNGRSLPVGHASSVDFPELFFPLFQDRIGSSCLPQKPVPNAATLPQTYRNGAQNVLKSAFVSPLRKLEKGYKHSTGFSTYMSQPQQCSCLPKRHIFDKTVSVGPTHFVLFLMYVQGRYFLTQSNFCHNGVRLYFVYIFKLVHLPFGAQSRLFFSYNRISI